MGFVDVTGPWEAHTPHALALATAAARKIEERLGAARDVLDEVIRFAFRSARGSSEPLLAVDADGRILAANAAGAAQIGLSAGRLPGDLRSAVDPLAVEPRRRSGSSTGEICGSSVSRCSTAAARWVR